MADLYDGQLNTDIRPKVRLEWAINFVGLQQPLPMRLHINQYYETVPDESVSDNYCPVRGPLGHTDVATKVMHRISHENGTTSRDVNTGTIRNTFSKIWDYVKPYVGPMLE